MSVVVECSIDWPWDLRFLFLLELNTTLSLFSLMSCVDLSVSIFILLNEGLALETLVTLVAMLTLLLREAFHELVHKLCGVRLPFGFLPPTASTSCIVAALLGRLS